MKIFKYSKLVTSLLFSTLFLTNTASALDAQLPYVDEVPIGEPMVIDGVWNMVALNKNVRFEGGRAYSMDTWVAYLFWTVHPEMVTLKDFRQTSLGIFSGYDLIQKVPASAKLQANGNLKFSAGLFVSDFVPVELDNPEMMAELLQSIGGDNSQPEYGSSHEPLLDPVTSNCRSWAIDPETNTPVCMD